MTRESVASQKDGRGFLNRSEEELVGIAHALTPLAQLNVPAAQAALQVLNSKREKAGMDRLADVIEKQSKAAGFLAKVGIALTIVIALAAVAQVVVMMCANKGGG